MLAVNRFAVARYALPLLLLLAAARVSASDSPDADRPADVPEEFVNTPNGYFHPSCVHEVRESDVVHLDHVRHADGSWTPHPACAHPHYDRSGKARWDASPPTVDSWVGQVASTNTQAVSWLSANWVVPTAPSTGTGQRLYFFPGLMPAAQSERSSSLCWRGMVSTHRLAGRSTAGSAVPTGMSTTAPPSPWPRVKPSRASLMARVAAPTRAYVAHGKCVPPGTRPPAPSTSPRTSPPSPGSGAESSRSTASPPAASTHPREP